MMNDKTDILSRLEACFSADQPRVRDLWVSVELLRDAAAEIEALRAQLADSVSPETLMATEAERDAWKDTAEEQVRNTKFYTDVLDKTAEQHSKELLELLELHRLQSLKHRVPGDTES